MKKHLKCPKCPKCRKAKLRMKVNVFVECSVDNRSLNKTGLRSRDVKIDGVGWPTALWFCPRCGWQKRLG